MTEQNNFFLKEVRCLRGVIEKDLATAMGCSPQTITDWETGDKSVTADDIIKLCVALETTPNVLFGFDFIDDEVDNQNINLKVTDDELKLILRYRINDLKMKKTIMAMSAKEIKYIDDIVIAK